MRQGRLLPRHWLRTLAQVPPVVVVTVTVVPVVTVVVVTVVTPVPVVVPGKGSVCDRFAACTHRRLPKHNNL